MLVVGAAPMCRAGEPPGSRSVTFVLLAAEAAMRRTLITVLAFIAPATLAAQQMDHAAHHAGAAAARPAMPGQAAYGAIGEIVRILEADSTTDWSKVDLERLRQHLVDMDEVTMRAAVTATRVEGGLRMTVTGSARTAAAIRRMVRNHGAQLEASSPFRTQVSDIAGGVRFTVTAKDGADARTVARIRGLGFIGLMVQGDHHMPHHIAMARGESIGGHQH
jgi:hypothetical protein